MENQRLQNVKLNNHWNEFIDKQIKDGNYSSADEVIAESLSLLEARKENQNKLEALRKAIEDGENSGEYTPFNPEETLKAIKKRAGINV